MHVWDVGTGQQTTPLPHLQDVTAVTWSLDGGHLIAGLGSGELLVLDARDGTEVRREAAHGREVANLALSRDGSRLASSSHDGTVRISSSSDLAFITSIRPSHAGASAIAWAPEGRSVATGGLDAVVQVWDPTSGALQGGLADRVPGSGGSEGCDPRCWPRGYAAVSSLGAGLVVTSGVGSSIWAMEPSER